MDSTKQTAEGMTIENRQGFAYYSPLIMTAEQVRSIINSSPQYTKVVFNFVVKDHNSFPLTLALIVWVTKPNGDFKCPEGAAIELEPDTNNSIQLDNDLQFSTLELSRRKFEDLIQGEIADHQYLYFKPIVNRSCKNVLSYEVSLKSNAISSKLETTEELNPCPPDRPS